MVAHINTVAFHGIEARDVDVQVHIAAGLPTFMIVGLPDKAVAEACFKQAIEIARGRNAKSFELRAAMGLARLWQGVGKRSEARNLLAPIYDWFTEGFDTTDLKEAKTLIDDLT